VAFSEAAFFTFATGAFLGVAFFTGATFLAGAAFIAFLAALIAAQRFFCADAMRLRAAALTRMGKMVMYSMKGLKQFMEQRIVEGW
jgi:hypothetical protein